MNFFLRFVALIGHILSSEGIDEVDSKKTDAVKNCFRPLTPSEIRIFLSFPNYYRMFVEGVSSNASPVMDVTQNKTMFVWSEACEKVSKIR